MSIVVENPVVLGADWHAMFSAPYWARGGVPSAAADPTLYRPLTLATLAIDHALWGLNATAFHATNIVLHAASTALVYRLALVLTIGVPAAFATAALFAVHPVHTESVTSIVGRADVLATVFVLSAFLLLRDRSGRAPGAKAVVGAAFWFAALLSKEIAATFPVLLVVDDYLHRDELMKDARDRVRLLSVRYLPVVVVAIAYVLLRQNAVTGDAHIWPPFADANALERVLTAIRTLAEYVLLFVVPWSLLAEYWVPVARSILDPAVLLALVFWLAVAAALLRYARGHTAVLLGVAWFGITILPVSNLLFPIGVAKAERFLYLPSVGLCLVAGSLLGAMVARVNRRRVAHMAFAVVLLALTMRTVRRNMDWRDNLTLALATLDSAPASPLMNDVAAGEYMQRGDAPAALPLMRAAVRESPTVPLLRTHLGAVHYALGMLDSAVVHYETALRLDPTNAEAANNLGVALQDLQRLNEALAAFQVAIQLRPDYADAHLNMGTLHLGQGRYVAAERSFTDAIRYNPSSAEAQNNLGVVYARQGRFDDAATRYREALRLNPSFERARANLDALAQQRSVRRP